MFRPGCAICSRRAFLGGVALGAAALWTPGVMAEELTRTPDQTEGPFYPDKLPLDTDNDLIVINDALTPAVGEIAYVSGRILDITGKPIKNAVVEIWQCDNNGAYLHSGTSNADKKDRNFQGFGRFTTASSGEYLFRTIKPVPYPGRTPHIHFKIKLKGKDILNTQAYIKGHPGNERDGIFSRLPEKAREAVSVAYVPLKDSKLGELTAKFDVVLGITPEA